MKPELRPCGTEAAYRRHLRRREVPCLACTEANRAGSGARHGSVPSSRNVAPPAPPNGLPIVPYEYQVRRYPWAERVLAQAEAMYGTPEQVAS